MCTIFCNVVPCSPVFTGFSGAHTAIIFGVEKQGKQVATKKKGTSKTLLSSCLPHTSTAKINITYSALAPVISTG